jgi:hypothetical protein
MLCSTLGIACVWLACGEGFGTDAEGSTTSGGNLPCMVASDCNAAPTPCSRAECADGTCRYTSVEAGRLPNDLQAPGDCRELVCDGKGEVVDQAANGDAPEDGKECTQGQCQDGAPVQVPVSEGTLCGENMQLQCNADGECAGCTSPSDCGEAPVCHMYKCSSGVCTPEQLGADTVLPAAFQMAGDCKVKVCNATGQPIDVADGNDPPDGTECADGHCEGATPMIVPLPNGTVCGLGSMELCCSGTCCAPLEICSNDTCMMP